jgi:hypothetical protein
VEEFFSFWLKMAPLAQGVGQKVFFCHNFGSIQHGRKVFEKIIVGC